jgi:penicillin-binding protein 1A
MTSDDPDQRPFFRRNLRRSLLDSLDDHAQRQVHNPDSAFDEPHPEMEEYRGERSEFDQTDPLPSFIQKEQAAQQEARDKQRRGQGGPAARRWPPLFARLKQIVNRTDRPKRFRLKAEAPAKRRSWKYRAARFTLYWGFVTAIWFSVVLVGAVIAYTLTAEDPLQAGLSKQPAKISILSDNGKVIAEKGLRRSHIKIKDMPPHLIQAVLATEDRRFYYHYGFDPIGIARAFIANYRAGRVVQGGSTVTQQLVKVLFLKPDRTYWRKVEEVLLSLSLEYRLEKDQILELYLNRIYFGAGNYGVESAAQHYFGKGVGDITLYEAAILAGLIRAPNYYSPTKDLERSLERGKVVLTSMRDAGDISEADFQGALNSPPALRNYLPSQSYGFIIDHVVQQLSELGLDLQADMAVETTIDYELQAVAQRVVKDHMDREAADYNAGEAAAIIIDRNGAIKAMIGGRDYIKDQFNRAVQAKRQPGSTFKPFVYLSALEKGLTPDTIVHDGPLRIGNWTPSNYNDRYYGDVTMREALAKSMNTVSVRLTEWAGRDNVIKTAHRLGIVSKLESNASIALGTSEVSLLELTSAYVPFANGGLSAMPHIIQSAKDAQGNVVYQVGRTDWGRVIRPDHVAAMNDMLMATIKYGTGNQAAIDPHPAAGKTGTGQDYRDAWFVGYTAHYVTGVWLGNNDFTPMKRVTGGSLPTQIWRDLMVYAHLNKEPAYLPGVNQLVAEDRLRPRQGGETLWDNLFGSTGSVSPDTTFGTPVASTRRNDERRSQGKSWLEDFFSQ